MATPIYANVVSVRITAYELILDFGCVFPDQPLTEPVQFTPDVRIVLGTSAITGLAQALGKAIEQQPKKAKVAPQVITQTTH